MLLDTHVCAWAILESARLSAAARTAIDDPSNEIFVSVVTPWEIAIKVGKDQWPEARALIEKFETEMATAGHRMMPIITEHVRAAGMMATDHRDPFDRLLVAQAKIEDLTLVSADSRVVGLGAATFW